MANKICIFSKFATFILEFAAYFFQNLHQNFSCFSLNTASKKYSNFLRKVQQKNCTKFLRKTQHANFFLKLRVFSVKKEFDLSNSFLFTIIKPAHPCLIDCSGHIRVHCLDNFQDGQFYLGKLFFHHQLPTMNQMLQAIRHQDTS